MVDDGAIIEPDGQDWTWVLGRPCPECGFDADAVDPAAVGAAIRDNAETWREVLGRADVRERPAAQVWSPLEYACHVRDLLGVFAARVELMLTEDLPTFENWDSDAAALTERYWQQDPSRVGAELADAARGNAEVWTRVAEEDWSRPGLRSNGSRFTIDSLGRYFLHDLRHHLHDVGA